MRLPAGPLQEEVELANQSTGAVVHGALARRGLRVGGQRGQRGAAVHRAQHKVDAADDCSSGPRQGKGGESRAGVSDASLRVPSVIAPANNPAPC